MTLDHSKLIGRIVEKFGTRRKFAEAVGLPSSALSYRLNGLTDISATEICRWSAPDLLDIPDEKIGEYFCTPKLDFLEPPTDEFCMPRS